MTPPGLHNVVPCPRCTDGYHKDCDYMDGWCTVCLKPAACDCGVNGHWDESFATHVDGALAAVAET